jgi:hypothetical protein
MKLETLATEFGKQFKYQILSKSVQWEPSCSMRVDGWRNITKQMGRHSEFCELALIDS